MAGIGGCFRPVDGYLERLLLRPRDLIGSDVGRGNANIAIEILRGDFV